MFKKILAVSAMLFAVAAFAAVDVNKGSAADLDGLKGVGPAMSKRILDARQKGEFKDWGDLMERVKGVKAKTAAKLSAEGLTVNGKTFTAPAAVPKGPAAKTAAAPAK
ncbi:ComEA family DNA-binding protein [Variovorax sp. LT2P21]|uniref:ComEA family DNA-binding protein n=1 Tax=Variovorax sp. LT2P21 TaxID=3443731 RepID=UPI003F477FEE